MTLYVVCCGCTAFGAMQTLTHCISQYDCGKNEFISFAQFIFGQKSIFHFDIRNKFNCKYKFYRHILASSRAKS